MNELPFNTHQSRKGIAYDWQSLYNADTALALREVDEFLTSEFELATTAAE